MRIYTNHAVEIALEMPQYLLQEDEALVEESGANEQITAPNKTSSTTHKTSVAPYKTTFPHKPLVMCSSAVPHKTSSYSTVLTKVSTSHPIASTTTTVELLQTVQSDQLNANPLHHGQTFDSQSAEKNVPLCVEDDAPRVNPPWSCDSHLTPAPLTVCFPQVNHSKNNQVAEGARLVSLNATPINIAPHMRNSCEKKKRRHGGGWPKGKSRRLDSHISLPKPPATG